MEESDVGWLIINSKGDLIIWQLVLF
jgi:hypothetical protein